MVSHDQYATTSPKIRDIFDGEYMQSSHLRVAFAALMCATAALGISAQAAEKQLAFPGALGWAADTVGGRGGKIIRVTTLAPSGPGSLLEAINTDGPRIVVFEVGGVIDLAKHEIKITNPYLAIAATAPSPASPDQDRHRCHDARCDRSAHSRAYWQRRERTRGWSPMRSTVNATT
jgi:hypothetical protein